MILYEPFENDEISLKWFVTWGIIQLCHTRNEDIVEKTIQVTKMYRTKHSKQIHLIDLDLDDSHLLLPRLIL